MAVSGGADSLALLHLAADWARRGKKPAPFALTVDHKLRKESAREAREAGRIAAALDVPHQILEWRQGRPKSGLQQEARRARYRLMAAWCRAMRVKHLLVAHTADDQAETFVMRLMHDSGPAGLAGMAERAELPRLAPGVTIARPLLGQSGAALRDYLSTRGVTWIEDPSNVNEAFERVRVRKMLALMRGRGEDVLWLTGSAANFARLKAREEGRLRRYLSSAFALSPAGFGLLKLKGFAALPPAFKTRAIAYLSRLIGGAEAGPRLSAAGALAARIDSAFRGATLGGARFMARKGALLIVREAAAVKETISLGAGEEAVWDNRFLVRRGKASGSRNLALRKLGEEGLKQLRARVNSTHPSRKWPAAALWTCPALFAGQRLAAVPDWLEPAEGRLEAMQAAFLGLDGTGFAHLAWPKAGTGKPSKGAKAPLSYRDLERF